MMASSGLVPAMRQKAFHVSWSKALSWGLVASWFSKQKGDSLGTRTMFSLPLYVVSLWDQAEFVQ